MDKPPEARRGKILGKIFQHIKIRAEKENKMVVVDKDLLIIDNVPVYFLLNVNYV